jgi:hypothetical protein
MGQGHHGGNMFYGEEVKLFILFFNPAMSATMLDGPSGRRRVKGEHG